MNRVATAGLVLAGVVALGLALALTAPENGEGSPPTTTTAEAITTTTISVSEFPLPSSSKVPWESPWPELLRTDLEYPAEPISLRNGEWAVVTQIEPASDAAISWYAVTLDPATGAVADLPAPPAVAGTTWGVAAGTPDGDIVVASSGATTTLSRLDGETLEWSDWGEFEIEAPTTLTVLDDGRIVVVGRRRIGEIGPVEDNYAVYPRPDEGAEEGTVVSLGDVAVFWPQPDAATRMEGFVIGAPVRQANTVQIEPPNRWWATQADVVAVDGKALVLGGLPGGTPQEPSHFVAAVFDPESDPLWGSWRTLPRALPTPTDAHDGFGQHHAVWNGTDLWVHVGGLSETYFEDSPLTPSVLMIFDFRAHEWLLVHRSTYTKPVPVGTLEGRVLLAAEGGIYLTPPNWRPAAEMVPFGGLEVETASEYPRVGTLAPAPPAGVRPCGAQDLEMTLGQRLITIGETRAQTPIYVENIGTDTCGLPVDIHWSATASDPAGVGSSYPVGRVDPAAPQFVEPVLEPGHVVAYTFSSDPFDNRPEENLVGLALRFPDGSVSNIDTTTSDDVFRNARSWHGPIRLIPDELHRPCTADDLVGKPGTTDGVAGKQLTRLHVTSLAETPCVLGLDVSATATTETVEEESTEPTTMDRLLFPETPTVGLQGTGVPYANSVLVPGQTVDFVVRGVSNGIVEPAPDIFLRQVRLDLEDGSQLVIDMPADSHAGNPSGWWGPVAPFIPAE